MLFKDFPQEKQDHLRQKEISVKPICVQRGAKRFEKLRNANSRNGVPVISTWRMNLIGLSQLHNLLFVACVDKVHVYIPEYPFQRLPDKPALILSPPQTPLAAAGYVDPMHPHSINNLFIDILGDLEILLLACDDGDVLGYYTNEVQAAIDRREDENGPDSIDGFDVRSFFQQNVEMSAWGLSIHSRSRKIAISANTHRVTVFTFGLVTSEWIDDDATKTEPNSTDPLSRDQDQRFELAAMNHNVPSVAFCNTDDDPDGRLLVSGDILGVINLWDLQQLQIMEIFRTEYCYLSEDKCDCHTAVPHAIWGLSWLDKKSFRKFEHYTPIGDFSQPNTKFSRLWNGNNAKAMIMENKNFSFFKVRPRSSGDTTEEALPEQHTENQQDLDLPPGFGSLQEVEAFNNNQLQRDQMDAAIWKSRQLDSNGHPWNASGNMDGKIFQNIKKEFGQPSQVIAKGRKRFPCPLFIASPHDICLYQPFDKQTGTNPFITMTELLSQIVQVDSHETIQLCNDLESCDRLSFQASIPELGVLIVGSPKGRVALLSLGQSPWEVRRAEPVFFYRLDEILPLKSQEDQGERPECRLVGIAVSPMPGQLGRSIDCEIARKWRLLLYYADHSVLNYELSKSSKATNGDDDLVL